MQLIATWLSGMTAWTVMVMAAADPPLDTPKTLPHAGTVAPTFTTSDTTGPRAVHGTEIISKALVRLAGSTDPQG
jgi:hypothetical protein